MSEQGAGRAVGAEGAGGRAGGRAYCVRAVGGSPLGAWDWERGCLCLYCVVRLIGLCPHHKSELPTLHNCCSYYSLVFIKV